MPRLGAGGSALLTWTCLSAGNTQVRTQRQHLKEHTRDTWQFTRHVAVRSSRRARTVWAPGVLFLVCLRVFNRLYATRASSATTVRPKNLLYFTLLTRASTHHRNKILTGCGGSVSLLVRPRFTLLYFTLPSKPSIETQHMPVCRAAARPRVYSCSPYAGARRAHKHSHAAPMPLSTVSSVPTVGAG